MSKPERRKVPGTQEGANHEWTSRFTQLLYFKGIIAEGRSATKNASGMRHQVEVAAALPVGPRFESSGRWSTTHAPIGTTRVFCSVPRGEPPDWVYVVPEVAAEPMWLCASVVGSDGGGGRWKGLWKLLPALSLREWIHKRLEGLASVFGVDVLTYAVISNRLHLILRNGPDIVAVWSGEQVASRWLMGLSRPQTRSTARRTDAKRRPNAGHQNGTASDDPPAPVGYLLVLASRGEDG